MKKFTLFLVATLFSALSFAALNPFAYGLSSELSADETTLTINYSLNATATSVNVVILNGETVVKTVDCSTLGLAKGSYTTTIPTDEFPKTTSLTWKVEVKGAEVTAPVESGSKKFYRPFSVAVDDNPESPYFGRILCGETYTSSATKYVSYGVGSGIYEFDPSFDLVPNGTKSGYNGGKTFTNNDHSPYRIRISDEGRIFVTAHDFAGDFLWELNPKNLNEWTSVFQGTHNSHQLLDAEGKFIAGTNAGFDVRGEGENLQLLMLSCDKLGTDVTTCQCHEYNLGTATEWSRTPSRKIIDGSAINNLLCARYSQVQYDKDGGFWATYYVNASTSGIVHFTKEGVKDYEKHGIAVRAAGLCFNRDYSKVIIAGNDIFGTLKETAKAVVYRVSKDADGKPVLTKETIVNMSSIGGNINDLAWDYADNIYAVGNNGEWLCAYPLPHAADKVVSTPCASDYAFELQESVGTIYIVTATASPAEAGTVAGAGEYAQDTEVTLTATANTGYRFDNWTIGSTTESGNPLTLTVTDNITATANFVALNQVTINATSNDDNMGTVTGGGTYYEGETVTLTATPKTGYRFVNWSNSSTDAKLTFTASENLNLTANFEIYTYTLTSFSNDETRGTVSGAGTYNHGATVTLEATPADGYKLLYWSDRSTDNPRTITMSKDEAISAYFVKEYAVEPTFTITKEWENTQVPSGTGSGYQAVGWDGKIYMQNKNTQKIMSYSNGTDAAVEYATSNAYSQQIAIDDAGNIILRNTANDFYNTTNSLLIIKNGETEGKVINFTPVSNGRSDFFSASGNLFSEEGGYVYMYSQNKTNVSRVYIKNGGKNPEDIVADAVGTNITGGNSQNHVIADIFDNIVAVSRSNAANWINVHTNESKAFTTLSGIKLSTLGGCSFELGGKELWAYNVGTTTYNSEWNIYNLTDKVFLSNSSLYAKNTTDKNSAANWLNVQVVDENTAYIYQFCPTVAVAVWKVKMMSGPNLCTVTATAENGTVTGNAGTYEEGAEVSLTATPNRGYRFVNWTKGGEIVSETATYTFNISEDVELVANFEALDKYTISAIPNDANMGWVDGAGDYYEGEVVTLTASAIGGYVFAGWSNSETTNTITFTATEDVELTANFKVAPARVFAYDLDVVDNGNDTYTFSFKANANATSGRLIIYNGETKVQCHEEAITGTIAKGVKKEITIDRSLLPETGTATWAVELTGEQVEQVAMLNNTADANKYRFYRPQGVAIDNNPASDFFGRIYIAYPEDNDKTTHKEGIVVLDPLHNSLKAESIKPSGVGAFNNGQYDMHRIAVNPINNKVYYTRALSETAIYEMTPDATNILTDGGTAQNVINGIGEITNANSLCFDKNGTMYVLANANYTNTEGSTGRIYKVVDGEATLVTASSREWASKSNSIVSDERGGFWVAQHRANLDAFSHLSHINADGVRDFNIDKDENVSLLPPVQTYTSSGTTYKNASYRGQVAYYAIDENNGLVAYGGAGKVSIFKVTYNGSGVPTLTVWQTISLLLITNTAAAYVDGLAFDYAGNLIVMSSSDERFMQYALPLEAANTSIVPSPTSKTILLGAPCNVQVNVNNSTWGSATGAGEYTQGAIATLTATANTGYRFVNWTKGEEVVSTDKTYTFTVTENVTLTANFEKIPEIAYELNGGQWNKYGWTSKKDMYDAFIADWKAYSGSTRGTIPYEDQFGIGKSNAGIPTTIQDSEPILEFMTQEKWEWLGQFLDALAIAQGKEKMPTTAVKQMRFGLGNFFGEDNNQTGWLGAVDCSGNIASLSAFAPYWGQTFPLPTQPTEEVVLNAPYREGYEFDGWYTTSDFSGAAVTTVDENTDGTLYAKWIEHFYTRTVTPGHYGTICLPYGSSSYSGAEFYEVSWLQKSGETPVNLYLDQLEEGTQLVAGKPYIFRATSTELTVTYTGAPVADPIDGANGLTGSFDAIPAGGVLTGNYVVAQTKFWTATATAYAAENRAYIDKAKVPYTEQKQIPGRRRVVLGTSGENAESGFEDIIAPEGKVIKVIENGQLIIIRDGEKYNVHGVRL